MRAMSYLQHFRLKDFPFALTPQRELFYPYSHHKRIIEAIGFAVRRGDGIVKIVGEVGTGKTMMSRILLHEMKDEVNLAYINNPQPDPDWIIAEIYRELSGEAAPAGEALRLLTDRLLETHREGKRTVVLIDEAHALGVEGLEAVRRLSNLETESTKLIQLVLFAQPELDELLALPALRQLAQRIPFAFETERMDVDASVAYVAHRIQGVADTGVSAFAIFKPKAIDRLVRRCAGIPRVINVVADKAMLIASGRGAGQVETEHVEDALADSRQVLASAGVQPLQAGRSALPAVSSSAVILAGAIIGAALIIAFGLMVQQGTLPAGLQSLLGF